MKVQKNEIYYADLNPVQGSEQGGIRPVLIIQNDIGNKASPTVIIGHSNISTTANIYVHVDSESKRESARIIDKVLSTEEAV